MGKATQDLRKEHEAILHVLEILDRMMRADGSREKDLVPYYGEVVDFLRVFADKCHHGKEEEHLFRDLVERGVQNEGGPIGAMLQEHVQGRAFIAQMRRSLSDTDLEGFRNSAVQYRDLLRQHIAKENDMLFVMADELIDERAQDNLFEQFEKHEETVIGHGVHEELHARIHSWEEAFGAG